MNDTLLSSFLTHWKSNYVYCWLDVSESWKLFAIHTNVDLSEIHKIANDRLLDWKSPSRELLHRWKREPTATIERFMEILSVMKLYEAVSLIQSWISDSKNVDTFIFETNTHNRPKKQKLNEIIVSTKSLDDTEFSPGEEEFRIGMKYYWRDRFDESVPYFEKSAERNYPPAFMRLCMIFQRIKKLPECNYTKQFREYKEWFREKALTGDPIAQYHMGLYCTLLEGDPKQEGYWQELSANQGYAPAQHNFATIWYKAEPKDYEKASYWFQRAAEQGYVKSQCGLGQVVEAGQGVQQDFEKAVQWYQLAADQADAESQCCLAWCFKYGRGAEISNDQAFKLYKQAAEQGSLRGYFSVAICYEDGVGVGKDEELAMQLYEKAAVQNHIKAQYNLGLCYYTRKNTEKAIYWFKKATDLGHNRAPEVLAGYYEKGLGVPRNFKMAAMLYEKAASRNETASQYQIGRCYAYGIGVVQDYQQAVQWYQKAAEKDFTRAQVSLGWCYELGNGVEEDHKMALFWIEKSQDHNALHNIKEIHHKEKCGKEEDDT